MAQRDSSGSREAARRRGRIGIGVALAVIALAIGLVFVGISWYGARQGGTEPAAAAGEDGAAEDGQVRGERIYGNRCVVCHQADGSGIAGNFPPLASHLPAFARVEGGREYLIRTVLYGLRGPIEVDGRDYNGVMPAFRRLSDADVAAVVNYGLQAWGNAERLPGDFEAVTADEVAAQRDLDLDARDVHDQRPEPTAE